MTTFQAEVVAQDGYTFPLYLYVGQGANYIAIRLSLAQHHKLNCKDICYPGPNLLT